MSTGRHDPSPAWSRSLPRFIWRRDPRSRAGQLGPVVLESVSLHVEPGDEDGPLIIGELGVLCQAVGALEGATVHLLARGPDGGPLSTDWESLPALQMGQQASIPVAWRLAPGASPTSLGVSLAVQEAVRCAGEQQLPAAPGAQTGPSCGPVALLALRVGVDAPDDDGDTPVLWMAEVDNAGPVLTEPELEISVRDDAGAIVHTDLLTSVPVLSGRQVLSFEGWIPGAPRLSRIDWSLALSTPRLFGPLDVFLAR